MRVKQATLPIIAALLCSAGAAHAYESSPAGRYISVKETIASPNGRYVSGVETIAAPEGRYVYGHITRVSAPVGRYIYNNVSRSTSPAGRYVQGTTDVVRIPSPRGRYVLLITKQAPRLQITAHLTY